MKIVTLLLLTPALLLAEVKTTVTVEGSVLPATIQGMPWVMMTNYAAADGNGDQGVGASYRGKDIKIDLYIYDSLSAEWAALPLAQRIEKEEGGIDEMFAQLIERGAYSEVNVVKKESITVAKTRFRHIEINFTDTQNGPLNSHYYLSQLNGKVFKIRISSKPSAKPAAVQAAFEEIVGAIYKN